MDNDFLLCNHNLEDISEKTYGTIKNYYSDTTAIYKALNFANSVHKTQVRSGSQPFILHPMRVALMLVHFDCNITSKVFMAALLHDVLETTGVTKMELEAHFGSYVADLVQSVTIPRKKTALDGKTREDKWRSWATIIGADHESRAIKTFENLDNILSWKTIPAHDPARGNIPRWLEETREMSLPLAHATNVQAYEIMQQEYEFYVAQGFITQSLTI